MPHIDVLIIALVVLSREKSSSYLLRVAAALCLVRRHHASVKCTASCLT
jgi:hypothetical protein